MDLEVILYIVIGIAWAVFSYLKKNKTKKTVSSRSAVSGNETESETYHENVEIEDEEQSFIEEVLTSKWDEGLFAKNIVRQKETSSQKQKATSYNKTPDHISGIQKPEARKGEDILGRLPKEEGGRKIVKKSKTEQKEELFNLDDKPLSQKSPIYIDDSLSGEPFTDNFDIRSAIIYSEILKRPEY